MSAPPPGQAPAPAPGPAFGELMPFAASIGVEILASAAEEVQGRLAWSPHLCTAGGILHGGAIMALADSTGALCAFNNIPGDSPRTTTIESKTNFFRAVRSGFVLATSRPLHAGRSVVVVDTALTDSEGRLVARVTQSQLVLEGR